MRNVKHSGNSCTVGWTCITADDLTDAERNAMAAFKGGVNYNTKRRGYSAQFGTSCYYDVRITDWPGVYSYLTILGHTVDFFPDYALNYSAGKWCEWKEVFPDIPTFDIPTFDIIKKHHPTRRSKP